MAETEERYQRYMDAIRRRVCSVCLDQRDDGACGLTGRTCAIEAHLPQIVEAVIAIKSDRMEDYVAAIQAQVCSRCASAAGPHCELRDRAECSLDAYLSLVIDAVEELRESSG